MSPAERRDSAAEQRDALALLRDQAADGRDEAGTVADARAEDRDIAGAHRDEDACAGDQKAADHGPDTPGRVGVTEVRDGAAGQRDDVAASARRAIERPTGPVRGTTGFARALPAPTDASADGVASGSGRRASAGELVDDAEIRRAAAGDRAAAASDRAFAHQDVVASSGDRESSADDRRRSAQDRRIAAADRQESARERKAATLDALTGAYLRGPGLVELEREIARHARSGAPFALVFLDVDRLKPVNDSGGHIAGDRLLRAVADTIRAVVRPYDLLVRFGGDEFVCALPGLSVQEATARMATVNAGLLAGPEHASVTVGVTALEPGDTVDTLVYRGDAALYRQRTEDRHT